MEQIKQALNKVFKIDKEFMELYDIIEDLKITDEQRKEIFEYLIDIDMAIGELEIRLEEIEKERKKE